ncbi:hypothetical protein EJ06DRAFT_385607 [Trichodelitschia bisporula]|uniref:Peroxin 20 n=1 Tax=Trichodelitschia bisporula TaxID=703511 RepID=A0A6G1HZ16_9PEZI|nr:hypothetical protein EJ06DRAFT_385607 [Trichodelitschia bisporula]
MADALCGPSNALQNFQKHAQVDRTLQQDRLTLRHSSSQGFRSQSQATGLLDPEFEAFQSGLPAAGPAPVLEQHPLQRFPGPAHHAPFHPAATPAAALPDWASDFQRLHIASPPAVQQQAPHIAHPQPQSQSQWHRDFLQSQASMAPMAPVQQPFQPYMSGALSGPSWASQPYAAEASYAPMVQEQAPQAVGETFDAVAFEAAFEAAQEDALAFEEEFQAFTAPARDTQASTTNHLTGLDTMEDQVFGHDPALAEYLDVLHAEPAIVVREEEQQGETKETEKPSEEDDLARTAGQLLDSVSHETNTKFQESVFLQLMRRIRDREVRVEGENFVEVGTSG